jgi:hypothetical protein
MEGGSEKERKRREEVKKKKQVGYFNFFISGSYNFTEQETIPGDLVCDSQAWSV